MEIGPAVSQRVAPYALVPTSRVAISRITEITKRGKAIRRNNRGGVRAKPTITSSPHPIHTNWRLK
jgi:hypothetical protein